MRYRELVGMSSPYLDNNKADNRTISPIARYRREALCVSLFGNSLAIPAPA